MQCPRLIQRTLSVLVQHRFCLSAQSSIEALAAVYLALPLSLADFCLRFHRPLLPEPFAAVRLFFHPHSLYALATLFQLFRPAMDESMTVAKISKRFVAQRRLKRAEK